MSNKSESLLTKDKEKIENKIFTNDFEELTFKFHPLTTLRRGKVSITREEKNLVYEGHYTIATDNTFSLECKSLSLKISRLNFDSFIDKLESLILKPNA